MCADSIATKATAWRWRLTCWDKMAAGEHGVHTEAAPGPVGEESGFEPGTVTAQREWASDCLQSELRCTFQRDLPVIVLSPANGGRTCYGNSYEFQLCSQEECPPLTDFRSVHLHLRELSVSGDWPWDSSCAHQCVCVCVTTGWLLQVDLCMFLSGKNSVKAGIHFMNTMEENITGCRTNTPTVITHIYDYTQTTCIYIHAYCGTHATLTTNDHAHSFHFKNLKIR